MAKRLKVPESEVEDLVRSGELQFPTGTDVNVINPEGKAVSLPAEELREAFSAGYKYETAFKGAVRKEVDKNDNLAGALKVFGGQAADEFLLGVPETAYDLTASPFDKAVKEGLKEKHDIANTLGGLTGFGTSFVYGGPLAKVAAVGAKAGTKAGGAIAAKLAEAGIKKGSDKIAKDILARTAENAARLGVEGTVVSAPMAISEAALGDPQAGAETLMLGGGLGAAFGIMSGTTGALFSKLNRFVGKRAAKAVAGESPFKSTSGERTVPDTSSAGDGTLIGAAVAEGADDSFLSTLKTELGKRKTNATEIAEAANELGLPVLEEQVAASKTIQDMASAIAQRPTLPGIARAQEYSKRFQRYDEALRQSLGVSDIQASRFEVGRKVKDKMLGAAKDAIDREGQIFNQLRMDYATIPLDEKPIKAVIRNIKDLAESELDDEAISVLNNVAKKIEGGRLGTLNDLFEMRSILYDMYGPNARKNKALTEVVKKLNYQEEETINRAIKKRIAAAATPGEATMQDAVSLQGAFDEMQQAKRRWADLAGGFEEGADALSLGNIKSPRDFVRRVDALTPEQLVQRMMPKRDVESLRTISSKFPDEFKLITEFNKAKLLEDTVVDGQINARQFVRKWRQLEPEVQDTLFGADGNKLIRAVRTDLESLPANVNPSGTAKTIEWFKALSPSNLLQSGTDALAMSTMRKAVSVEGLLGVEKQINAVRGRLDKVGDYISGLGKATAAGVSVGKTVSALNALSGDESMSRDEAFKNVQGKISEAMANPEFAVTQAADTSYGLSDTGAPGIAGAYGQNLVRAVTYLHQSMPKALAPQSQFYKVESKPSDSELASFERKLSVVMDPFTVFDALADNSLTKDHVESLAVNYPLLYQAMRQRVIDQVSEGQAEIPYQSRLKLSLLMGFNVDQSTDPQHVASFQNAFLLGPQDDTENDGLRVSGLQRLEPEETMATPTQRMMARSQS